MKKIFYSVFTLILVVCLGIGFAPSFISLAQEQTEEEIKEVSISSSEEFISTFEDLSIYDKSNVIITLNNDIDLAGYDLSHFLYYVDEVEYSFNGTFDGNGYTISNLNLVKYSNYVGLFPKANGATIKNLKISGNVSFDLGEVTQQSAYNTIYAGVLIGYGVNVTVENCSLGLENISQERIESETISLDIQSNFYYGDIAGYLTSQTGGIDIPKQRTIVKNCISYFNHNFNISKDLTLNIGSLIGNLASGSQIYNCATYGNINISSSVATPKANIGGMIGLVSGSSKVSNLIFLSQLTRIEQALQGAIIGNKESSASANYCYYTYANFMSSPSQSMQTIYPTGNENISSETFGVTSLPVNSSFFNISKFDSSVESWNFDTIWMINSYDLRLQRFENFTFQFARSLDSDFIIKNALFNQNSNQDGVKELNCKWGSEIVIEIELKEAYYNFYNLKDIKVNESDISVSANNIENIYNEEGKLKGFNVKIIATDLTDGSYSFEMTAINYTCEVSISQDAKNNNSGFVRINDGAQSSDTLFITYTYDSKANKISAVKNGIYVFDYWKLFYKDEESGEFTVEAEDFYNQNTSIEISFGQAPFNKEFRLEAYFTDEDAVLIDFPKLDNKKIKSVTIAGEVYNGEVIAIAPDSNISLEIVTMPNYIIDIKEFTQTIKQIYGNIEPSNLLAQDPIYNEETKETTYIFNLNTRYISSDNVANITIISHKDNSDMQKNLIYVYIFVPIGVVLIGLAIFLIIRHRGGGRGSKGQTNKKEKEKSYKDYYI